VSGTERATSTAAWGGATDRITSGVLECVAASQARGRGPPRRFLAPSSR
jgi:hypothetical protein